MVEPRRPRPEGAWNGAKMTPDADRGKARIFLKTRFVRGRGLACWPENVEFTGAGRKTWGWKVRGGKTLREPVARSVRQS